MDAVVRCNDRVDTITLLLEQDNTLLLRILTLAYPAHTPQHNKFLLIYPDQFRWVPLKQGLRDMEAGPNAHNRHTQQYRNPPATQLGLLMRAVSDC